MTTRFDNMNAKQLLARLNELREQNDIPVLQHAKSRDKMIAEIVKLSPVTSRRYSDVAQFARDNGLQAKCLRALYRRHGLSQPYDINDPKIVELNAQAVARMNAQA